MYVKMICIPLKTGQVVLGSQIEAIFEEHPDSTVRTWWKKCEKLRIN